MPRFRHFIGLFGAIWLTFHSIVPSFASSPWTEVGAQGRPPWVFDAAERRLRLLYALPAIEEHLHVNAQKYFKGQGPGMTVGLVLDDGLFYSQGFGFADVNKSIVPDENTIFRPGSLSKVMTGTALLTLIDDPSRHMTLIDAADDTRYLPELKFVCRKWAQPCDRAGQNGPSGIQLGNLVSHTSGLADVLEQDNASVSVWLSDLKKSWLLFTPGKATAYSGVGVEAAGLIEQKISGEPYPEFVRKNLFAPLGMMHSTMNPTVRLLNEAQIWEYAPSGSSWSFTPFNGLFSGDDQPMIQPAGGLKTNVMDLSLFLQMWLSGKAPLVNGRPILKDSTINSATEPFVTSNAAAPAYCLGKKNGEKDSSNFSYSPCEPSTPDNVFGVDWFVGETPYIEHNGQETGLSGSNTRVDQKAKMAATELISTDPYPAPAKNTVGLDSNFANTATVYAMLNEGIAADSSTSWSHQALAIGVARVLYLSGKALTQNDLNGFTPAFIAQHSQMPQNQLLFLTLWQNQVGKCSTFRVRGVRSQTEIEVRFRCEKSEWDILLTVESGSPHRIAWEEVSPVSHDSCIQTCSIKAGQCMSTAHGSGMKQMCTRSNKMCQEACQ